MQMRSKASGSKSDRSKLGRMLHRWADSSRIGPDRGRELGRSLGARC